MERRIVNIRYFPGLCVGTPDPGTKAWLPGVWWGGALYWPPRRWQEACWEGATSQREMEWVADKLSPEPGNLKPRT